MLKTYKEEVKRTDKEALLNAYKPAKITVRKSPIVCINANGDSTILIEKPKKAKL